MLRIENFSGKTLTYLLMTGFCAGELAGAAAYCSCGSEGFETLEKIAELFFRNRLGCTFIQTVVNSFSGAFLLMLLCLLLGFGAVFQPVEAAVPFFHGMGIGVVLTEMNVTYGFKGMLVSALMILPYAAASAVMVIAAAREAVLMSCCVGKRIFGRITNEETDVRLYLTKFLALFGMTAALSVADGILTYFFAGLWTRFLGV